MKMHPVLNDQGKRDVTEDETCQDLQQQTLGQIDQAVDPDRDAQSSSDEQRDQSPPGNMFAQGNRQAGEDRQTAKTNEGIG
jgi:hypothetical protein